MKALRTHALSEQLQAAKVRDKLAFSHMFDHACKLEGEIAKLAAERDGIFRELELTEMQVEMLKKRLAIYA